jgi:hypothetical protein
VRETAVLLAVAWLIPFLVHVLPWSGTRPLGAHLLPMFWATFAAVYFYGLRVGLLTGLFAPVINLIATGLPALQFLSVLAFELAIFAVFAWLMTRRSRAFWLTAPLGYVVAKICSSTVQLFMAPFGDLREPLRFFLGSLQNGLAGLAVLMLINFGLVRLFPQPVSPADDAAGV